VSGLRRAAPSLVLAGAVVVAAAALVFAGRPMNPLPAAPTERPEVTATVVQGTVRSVVVLNGVAEPAPQVNIQAPASGTWAAIRARVGDRISRAQALGRIRVNQDGEVTVTAPASGTLVAWAARDGDSVKVGQAIGAIASDGFEAVAVVPPEVLYRFYGRPLSVTIKLENGPGPFECPLKNLGAPLTGTESDPASVPVKITCAIPPSVRVFSGVRLKLAAVTGESKNVMLLPLTAVAGAAERGYVIWVTSDGRRARRDVRLGLTDGVNIEITDGLRVGDVVAVPPTDASDVFAP
jgi:multidrug efflux pump subunit AcrA (membrane-fusion protein)